MSGTRGRGDGGAVSRHPSAVGCQLSVARSQPLNPRSPILDPAPFVLRRSAIAVLALLALGAVVGSTSAQEPILGFDSATAPSPGHFIVKEQFRFESWRLDSGPRNRQGAFRDACLNTTVNFGATRDLSFSLRFPVVSRERTFERWRGRDREQGVGDVDLLAKYRFWRRDTGALDTMRLSAIAGARIRTGDAPFTGDAYNPVIGLAYTQIAGRHGFNAAVSGMFTTGGSDEPVLPGESTADLVTLDLAYLFRVYPEAYTMETKGALYVGAELNGLYETNGDAEIFLAPAIMWEAQRFVLELSAQVPVYQEIDHRARKDYAIIAGVRFLF